MKNRNLRYLTLCWFALATFIVSCGLQPSLRIEQHQVCSNSKNAASQCQPIGGNQLVLIQNTGASLKLYPLQADSLVDPSVVAGASSDALHQILSAHEMLLHFDPLTTSLVWRRRMLNLVDANSANEVRLNTDPSISFLLIQAPGSQDVAIAAIKSEPCSGERDIVAYLDSLYRIDPNRDEVVFYTGLNFDPVQRDGGLGILVIDPIIIDAPFQILGIRNYWLLHVIDSKTQAASYRISYFVPIAPPVGGGQHLQAPALKTAVQAQALRSNQATTWVDADFIPLRAYPMENTSITACNSIFSFTVAGKLKLIINATECPFKIVSNRDQLRYEVHILKGRAVQLDNDKR